MIMERSIHPSNLHFMSGRDLLSIKTEDTYYFVEGQSGHTYHVHLTWAIEADTGMMVGKWDCSCAAIQTKALACRHVQGVQDFRWAETEADEDGGVWVVVAEVMLHAYRDIAFLLQEGFDTNVDDCKMAGVEDTIKELKHYIKKIIDDPTK